MLCIHLVKFNLQLIKIDHLLEQVLSACVFSCLWLVRACVPGMAAPMHTCSVSVCYRLECGTCGASVLQAIVQSSRPGIPSL